LAGNSRWGVGVLTVTCQETVGFTDPTWRNLVYWAGIYLSWPWHSSLLPAAVF